MQATDGSASESGDPAHRFYGAWIPGAMEVAVAMVRSRSADRCSGLRLDVLF